jgi:pimeloyl-ACP methyl ester carboxylesterase
MTPKIFSLIALLTFVAAKAIRIEDNEISFPYLNPLLKFNNGTRVENIGDWKVRRNEISKQLQEYILGTIPEIRPTLISSTIINKTKNKNKNAISTFYYLTYESVDSDNITNASFYVEVISPTTNYNNNKKLPMFLTQWNHREWGLLGVSRGYISMIYPGSDTRDAAPLFQSMFMPKYTMKLILARAFVASLALDFVFQYQPLNEQIDLEKICITGHSRNGKQSLLAAAFDERITAVVGSSPGAPIASPYHISSHNYYGEGPDAGRAGQWWSKTILNFTKHPEQLPMDGHGVISMIAPRNTLIASGYTDHEGDITFANEYSIVENMKVFSGIYNKSENLRILHRPGDHHGFVSVNAYFDFFDVHFNIEKGKKFAFSYYQCQNDYKKTFPLQLLTPAGFDWEVWKNSFKSQTPPPPPLATNNLLDRINWLLQLNNATIFVRSVGTNYAEDSMSGVLRYPSVMMGHDLLLFKQKQLKRMAVSFGNYVTANVYWYEKDTALSSSKLLNTRPAVIWLHPYSYSTGYYASYERDGLVVDKLAKAGYVVLAYDQIGFGTRLLDGGSTFYARYGNDASLFGTMVSDAISGIDFLECRSEIGRYNSSKCGDGENHIPPYSFNLNEIPVVNSKNIYVAGYSLGGNVALHTASIEQDRVAGVASFAGFTPFRTDFNYKPTYGIKRLYDFHALIPRLGLFQNSMASIPYDYDELIGSIAPRNILLYTPMDDRDSTYEDVDECLSKIKNKWKGTNNFNYTSIKNMGTAMGQTESDFLYDWLLNLRKTM